MWAINYLVRMPGVDKIIVADINQDIAERVINGIAVSSSIHGFYPKLEFKRVDLSDKDGTAKVLGEAKPTVILNTSTMLANYVPAEKRLIAEKKFPVTSRLAGHTIAKDLFLTMKLMEAVKSSGVASKVVNVSFPDHKLRLGKSVCRRWCGTIDLTANEIPRRRSKQVPLRNI
jgi:hypothetical protein